MNDEEKPKPNKKNETPERQTASQEKPAATPKEIVRKETARQERLAALRQREDAMRVRDQEEIQKLRSALGPEVSEQETTRKDEAVLLSAFEKFRLYNDPQRGELEASTNEKPYVIEHKIDAQDLLIIGVTHTNDPESRTLNDIRSRRDDFLAGVPKEKALFMVEGMHGGIELRKELAGIKDEREAIEKFGEKGALMWKAQEQGIEITSPEMPENQVVQELEKQGFNHEEIALTFLLRDFTSQIGRASEKVRDDTFRQESLEMFAKKFFSLQEMSSVTWIKEMKSETELQELLKEPVKLQEYMSQIVRDFIEGANMAFERLPNMQGKKLIPSLEALLDRDQNKIPIEDVNDFYDPSDKADRKGITNQISSAYQFARDQYLTRKIYEALKDGRSPLVVYGASHAITIEPAIEEIVHTLEIK